MDATVHDQRWLWRFAVAVATFSLLFFARSLTSYFVCDDYFFLGRINFANAATYFTESWGYGNEYRPLLPYSYALDRSFSGESPVGYHLTNIVLHVSSGLLIAPLSLKIGLSRRSAALASLIFILNPVTHEAVLWIAGRPVVLVTFLMLACCWSFLNFLAGRRWPWLAATYVFFVAGLGVYELAMVTPLLVIFLAWMAGHTPREYSKHAASLLVIAGVYVAFWLWFFEFRFTRIQIEHSFLNVAGFFSDAVAHSFHGSLRWDVGPVYLFLVASLARSRRGRLALGAWLVWFVIAYLPYFAVAGYADRFVYAASAGTAALLSEAVWSLGTGIRKPALVTAIVVLGFFSVGMQNRISAWKEAGEIARVVTLDIKREMPVFAVDREVVLLKVPAMHKRSYVYLKGLDRAIQRAYPGERIRFSTTFTKATSADAIVLEYSNGHMVRKTWQN
jgi:hypothetical protein